MMANAFDQFDGVKAGNAFDQFDAPAKPLAPRDAMLAKYKVDPRRPVADVRADLDKLNLDENSRKEALDLWADDFVGQERETAAKSAIGTPIKAAEDVGRWVSRGTFAGPWLDEIEGVTQGALHSVSGGAIGAPYDETVAYQRALDRAADKSDPGLALGVQIGSGVLGGGLAVKGAQQVGKTAIDKAANLAVGGPFAVLPKLTTPAQRMAAAGGVGAVYGANYGAGETEGDLLDRAKNAAIAAPFGMVAGAAGQGVIEAAKPVGTALWKVLRPTEGAYEDVAKNLGDVTPDDMANRLAVGISRQQLPLNRRAFDALGEAMQAAGGDQRRAIAMAAQRLVRDHGVTQSAAVDQIRRAASHYRDSDLVLSELPDVLSAEESARQAAARRSNDIPRETVRSVSDFGDNGVGFMPETIVHQGSGKSADRVRAAFSDRARRQRDSMADFAQSLAPRGANMDDVDNLVQALDDQASQAYAVAYGPGGYNQDVLTRGLRRAIDNARQRLGPRAGQHAEALAQAIDEFEPVIANASANMPAARGLLNNLQSVQDARAVLRGMRDEAARKGRNDIVRMLEPLYQDVTNAMSASSPAWRQANNAFGHSRGYEDMAEFGQAMTQKAGPRQREMLQEFDAAAPERQDIMRIGYLQQLDDKLKNLGQKHDVAKMFETDGTFELIRRLFGKNAAVDFIRKVRDMKVATRSERSMHGSQTAGRLARAEVADGEIGMIGAANSASIQGFRGWLASLATNFLRERKNRRLADILTTPVSNTARMSQHIANLRAARDRLRTRSVPPRVKPIVTLPGIAAGKAVAASNNDRNK